LAFLVLAGQSALPGYYVTALAEVRVTLQQMARIHPEPGGRTLMQHHHVMETGGWSKQY
jgi:hypothetical protein